MNTELRRCIACKEHKPETDYSAYELRSGIQAKCKLCNWRYCRMHCLRKYHGLSVGFNEVDAYRNPECKCGKHIQKFSMVDGKPVFAELCYRCAKKTTKRPYIRKRHTCACGRGINRAGGVYATTCFACAVGRLAACPRKRCACGRGMNRDRNGSYAERCCKCRRKPAK